MLKLFSLQNTKFKESLHYKNNTIAQLKCSLLSTSSLGNEDTSANIMITNLAKENIKLKKEIKELKAVFFNGYKNWNKKMMILKSWKRI